MSRSNSLKHVFVEFIPDELEEGTLYVSVQYATVAHLCCCGCAREVVTPLTPTDWTLLFDGETTSLAPSIGNWSFPCQSHYWIKRNTVCWADKWTDEQIRRGRLDDAKRKGQQYQGLKPTSPAARPPNADPPAAASARPSIWRRLCRLILRNG